MYPKPIPIVSNRRDERAAIEAGSMDEIKFVSGGTTVVTSRGKADSLFELLFEGFKALLQRLQLGFQLDDLQFKGLQPGTAAADDALRSGTSLDCFVRLSAKQVGVAGLLATLLPRQHGDIGAIGISLQRCQYL